MKRMCVKIAEESVLNKGVWKDLIGLIKINAKKLSILRAAYTAGQRDYAPGAPLFI